MHKRMQHQIILAALLCLFNTFAMASETAESRGVPETPGFSDSKPTPRAPIKVADSMMDQGYV